MARPRKDNADYFSHDNDMRNDDKILSVRRKFWHEWYSVWNMLLEKLCKSTWFIIDVDNVSIELLSWDFVVDPEKLKEIIDYFVYIRLIFREWDRIYSQKMIDRFEWLLSKRQRDIEYRQWKQKEEIVIDVEKPQSKVKESKIKEIKEYNISIPPEIISFIDKQKENMASIAHQVKTSPNYINKQAVEYEKLLNDLDKLNAKNMSISILEFITNDDFWKNNIWSITKLRSKNKDWIPYYIVMLEKMKQSYKKTQSHFIPWF